MKPHELLKRVEDEPFKPFRIHLDDGQVIPRFSDVQRPAAHDGEERKFP